MELAPNPHYSGDS